MSDAIETGDTGTDYGHYEAGQESAQLDQLHQVQGSEADAQSQFGVYENDHHAQESTNYQHGTHVEFDQTPAVHYEADEYTNFSHSASEDDHVFAAEGSQSSHQAEFSQLDALEQRLDAAFARGTVLQTGGDAGAAEIGPASS
ncbi:hypothetical protein AB0M46_07440 [Dactylosporangium sp. NPDC051485]|uniref:hypothetical protein n=1 Tax=Dactylosporangium sp. NPDC051485 TaxID=3154846 RepID=UPI00344A87F2